MKRILVNDDWYDAVDTAKEYESAFEAVVMGQARALFPGYRAIPFRRTVYSETDAARPDYALIEKGYQHWWVVEVEMHRHSLERHVLPQVETLCSARYGLDDAGAILNADPGLDPARVEDLLRGLAPRVLVVVDRPEEAWVSPLRRLDAELAVFEIYRSDRGRFVFRVEGFLPVAGAETVSRCWLDEALPMLVKIASPGALPLPRNSPIEIVWRERVTLWKRVDSHDAVWLVAHSTNPLQRGKPYELVFVPDGVLRFRETVDSSQPRR